MKKTKFNALTFFFGRNQQKSPEVNFQMSTKKCNQELNFDACGIVCKMSDVSFSKEIGVEVEEQLALDMKA